MGIYERTLTTAAPSENGKAGKSQIYTEGITLIVTPPEGK